MESFLKHINIPNTKHFWHRLCVSNNIQLKLYQRVSSEKCHLHQKGRSVSEIGYRLLCYKTKDIQRIMALLVIAAHWMENLTEPIDLQNTRHKTKKKSRKKSEKSEKKKINQLKVNLLATWCDRNISCVLECRKIKNIAISLCLANGFNIFSFIRYTSINIYVVQYNIASTYIT